MAVNDVPGSAPPPGPLGPGVERVHMVGIGGAGMEALARLLRQAGYRVTGSDAGAGAVVDDLRRQGIEVHGGHDAGHVRGADLVVYSAAVGADNCERRAAEAAGIPQRRRAEILGAWSRTCATVAVAGTHGKTTTASLIAAAAVGRRPAVAIGGWVEGRTQARGGDGELLVAEADEYDRSFLELTPWIAVVTNLEVDHVDCYAGEAAVVDAFTAFLGRTRADGTVIANGDDPRCLRAAAGLAVPVVTFGFGAGCDVRAAAVEADADGTRFELVAGAQRRAVSQRLPGRHNVANTLAAWAAARAMGLDEATTAVALSGFGGVDRRFQRRAVGGVTVVDDYAHHPTEVAATLAAARELAADGRVLAVFQPHTYSRTRHFAGAFAQALAAADRCWVTAVYAARERPADGAEADAITAAMAAAGGDGRWVADADLALRQALQDCRRHDWLVVMGAGDIGQRLAACLADREGPA